MQIEIKKVNKILNDLNSIYSYNFKLNIPKGYSLLAEDRGENWERETQGKEGEYYYILQYESYFIKVTLYSDSYGNTDHNKKSIQFVTPTVKTVTDYTAI